MEKLSEFLSEQAHEDPKFFNNIRHLILNRKKASNITGIFKINFREYMREILSNNNFSISVDEVSVKSSGKSFIGICVHYWELGDIKKTNFGAQNY